jgi:hypothetical protein
MVQLYPQALGSLFVAFYDSQGYGGGIRPCLTGNTLCLRYKDQSDMMFRGKKCCLLQKNMKHANTICWQNSEFHMRNQVVQPPDFKKLNTQFPQRNGTTWQFN